MEEQEKQFIKGFNNGYFIAKYQPDLFEKLEKISNPDNEYFQGLLSGKKEYTTEKNILLLKDLKHDIQLKKANEREQDFGKER